MHLFSHNDFIIVDLETTGLSPHYDKITEIAAIKIEDNKIINKFESFINPEIEIPINITRLTGISNQMVKDAPKAKDVLKEFLKFAGSSTIVAHNANFDISFLQSHLSKNFRLSLTNPTLCTKELAKLTVPEINSKALAALCRFFEIENINAHRAMSDVKATYQIFNIMRKRLSVQSLNLSNYIKTHSQNIALKKIITK